MTAPMQRQAFERATALPLLARMLVAFQTGVLESFTVPFALPFIRGKSVEVAALGASGTFTVKHGLGRTPSGWLVLDVERAAGATGDLVIYRRATDTRDASAIVLYGSASFTSLTLWVW